MSARNLVLDSSVWIEILNQGPLAKLCLREMKGAGEILVPSIVLFEVYKKIALLRSEDQALSAIAMLSQNEICDLTREIALTAADISIQKSIPMADSIVLAHAYLGEAELITLDHHFSGIPGAKVLKP